MPNGTDSPGQSPSRFDRRELARIAAGIAATSGLALASSSSRATAAQSSDARSLFAPGDALLFQGDSTSDAGRDRALANEAPVRLLGSGARRDLPLASWRKRRVPSARCLSAPTSALLDPTFRRFCLVDRVFR